MLIHALYPTRSGGAGVAGGERLSGRGVDRAAPRTVTPAMAAPMQRLADALKRKRTRAASTRMFLVHQSPQAGTPTPAVATGVRALPWEEFLEAL